MPAVSQAQQRLMAVAEHAPGKLYKRNRGVLNMSMADLHDFAATPRTGLPKRKSMASLKPRGTSYRSPRQKKAVAIKMGQENSYGG